MSWSESSRLQTENSDERKTTMRTLVQVLSQAERDQVHERSLEMLQTIGVRVDTLRGRRLLAEAGAVVDETNHIVRLPRTLVEHSLRCAPRKFSLGGRRPGWSLPLNEGCCTLSADGSAVYIYDSASGERLPGTYDHWLKATRLIDTLDEVGVYWKMVESVEMTHSANLFIRYWRDLLNNYSKHIQESTSSIEESRWLLEILQVVFGDREILRKLHPLSFIICPFSPLVIEETFTDAYLEIAGWDIPVVIMPMPLMGMTSPASLLSTLLLGNCEVLAMNCLVQAASPGTPVIYAPALAVMEPRTGRYSGGAVEHALLGAVVTEMASYYNLPCEACAGGSDHHIPGIQASYERAINWTLPALSSPDILVGPGLLSGSTMLSFEQLILDVEVFKRCQRLSRGIECEPDKWLEEVLSKAGPGGSFLSQRSTREALKAGEWQISKLGVYSSFEKWVSNGRAELLGDARQEIEKLLAAHQPIPLDETILRELAKIERRAGEY